MYIMIYLVIFLLVAICLALFFFAFHFFIGTPDSYQNEKKRKKSTNSNKPQSRCVICNSILEGTEKLISKVYPTANGTDQRCIINGCPHCQPYCDKGVTRHCPVCGKKIPPEGYLIARMFIKSQGKNHVHVIGCTECHKKS